MTSVLFDQPWRRFGRYLCHDVAPSPKVVVLPCSVGAGLGGLRPACSFPSAHRRPVCSAGLLTSTAAANCYNLPTGGVCYLALPARSPVSPAEGNVPPLNEVWPCRHAALFAFTLSCTVVSAARVHVVVKIDGCFVVRSVHHTVKVLCGWAVYIFNCRGVCDQRSRRQAFRPSVAQCVRAANCVGLVKAERVYGFKFTTTQPRR